MLNLVLFGPPGAGKGTQSASLIAHYGLIHLSTGDLLRNNIKNNTSLGQIAKKYSDAGDLVPDSVVIDMVADKISANTTSKGFIFDGFPRTVNQAEALDKILQKHALSISGMISLEVPIEELINRLKERGKSSKRVDDQDTEKINHRLSVYNNETATVAEYYKKHNKFEAINGVGNKDDIFKSICKIISSY